MRKTVKRVLVSMSLVGVMSASLVGCAKTKTTECEMCGQTKKCTQYEMTALGETETAWICSDCEDLAKAAAKAIGGKMKKA